MPLHRPVTGGDTVASSEAIEAMTERIVQGLDPSRIILFGSHARGDTKADSDVDLLVVLSSVADKREVVIQIRRALKEFNVSKNIVVATPDEIEPHDGLVDAALRPALRDGKVLYER